jgi:hypothetical protein
MSARQITRCAVPLAGVADASRWLRRSAQSPSDTRG